MRNKIFIALCLLSFNFFGQVLGVDTIYKSGPLSQRINIVVVSEGFLASEMNVFTSKVNNLTNYLFNQDPFKQYKRYFNVFAIRVVSPESGVSHPGTATDVSEPQIPVESVNNLFMTTFDNNHTHRAIVSNNAPAIYNIMATHFPAYTEIVVLANSNEYGGTGGAYAVMSINSSAPETLVHELGHSFAGLADEYWAGMQFAIEKPNMTATGNASTVKWSQWVGSQAIGVYSYSTTPPASNWFRPHQNCKMQFLSVPFCAVCKQTLIEKIHDATNPIDAYMPSNTSPITLLGSQWFKAKFIKPIPNTLRTSWEINQMEIAHNKDSVLLDNTWISPGLNQFVLTAMDTTALSRDVDHPNLHTYQVVWEVDYTIATGIKEIKQKLELSMFPNPAADQINLEYTLNETSEIGVSVLDISGKAVISEKSKRTVPGTYKTTIDVTGLTPGNYIVALKINDQTINNKIIIFK